MVSNTTATTVDAGNILPAPRPRCAALGFLKHASSASLQQPLRSVSSSVPTNFLISSSDPVHWYGPEQLPLGQLALRQTPKA
eukprot:CAMPEP_0113566782 /NCGR_PEP_ID=MMETSP0015_2-20120614/22913_1 /TAXON_ID=2838 /ORGANISM="Odontella" /LENGTH=81 /DNA_ID=CAMNT_0000469107 /DNA_START=211 /DNA_END=456 /DNA_ORIENTATION=- /assembly_acc=CAM_ASM_000160